MNIVDGIVKAKTFIHISHVVKKHSVVEDVDAKRPTVKVTLGLVNIIKDVSELTRLIRGVRQRIPSSYAVKFTMRTTL